MAIAMSEPGAGSGLQSVKTTAIRQGDKYIVNGGANEIMKEVISRSLGLGGKDG